LGQGEAFRKTLKKEGEASEAAWTHAKTQLEAEWHAFEASVEEYVEAAGKQAGQQAAAFRARADAQAKAWREATDRMNKTASGFVAEQRADVEAAVKRMKEEAAKAQAKLDKLGKAGAQSWAALNTALGETRRAFDRASQAVYDAFKHAA
jgi:ElaB/YqjD/DUF883 family membrane-anchored ribosome-binding protein